MIDVILDTKKRQIVRVEVESSDGNLYLGQIVAGPSMPDDIRELFVEYSERIDTQVLTGLERYESAIEAHGFMLAASGTRVHDLQIIGDKVSFRIAEG